MKCEFIFSFCTRFPHQNIKIQDKTHVMSHVCTFDASGVKRNGISQKKKKIEKREKESCISFAQEGMYTLGLPTVSITFLADGDLVRRSRKFRPRTATNFLPLARPVQGKTVRLVTTN